MREKDKMHIRENVQAMYIFELLMGWLDRSAPSSPPSRTAGSKTSLPRAPR